MEHQSRKSKEEGKPGQSSVERDSADLKPASPLLSVGNEQGDVAAISERMAFFPVVRCGTVNFLVDTLKQKTKAKQNRG